MSKSAIYVSGWEYNRVLADHVLTSKASGLPAQLLWDGAAQFWMFEHVYCTKESLDGDIAAAVDLGWTTGFIFENLQTRGFLKPVEWTSLTANNHLLKSQLEDAWRTLRTAVNNQVLLTLLEKGKDAELEAIKLTLLRPILTTLGCVTNISPNSIKHWIPSENAEGIPPNPIADAARQLAEPLVKGEQIARAGITVCNPPGTGVDEAAARTQEEVEQRVQRPMIPRLLAGLLPQPDYHDALRPTAHVYRPINEQLRKDYQNNIDRLERLRDIARGTLWPTLHGEWIPRLEEDPSFLPHFKLLLRDSLLQARFDPYLEWTTDIAINTTSIKAGLVAGTIATAAGVPLPASAAVGAGVLGALKRVLDGLHKRRREATDGLAKFYQKARKALRNSK